MSRIIFMSQFYSMKSLIYTAQARALWGLHMSTIKWGWLTLT